MLCLSIFEQEFRDIMFLNEMGRTAQLFALSGWLRKRMLCLSIIEQEFRDTVFDNLGRHG